MMPSSWKHVETFASSISIRWAYGLWIPVITSVLISRSSQLTATYPSLLLINYPLAVGAALSMALSAAFWAAFATMSGSRPPRIIRENLGRDSYIEKIAKTFGSEPDWDLIYSEHIQKWDREDQLSRSDKKVMAVLALLAATLSSAAVFLLILSLLQFLPSIFH